MKKALLLASAALLAANVMVAEEIDITPKGYKFYETQQMCAIHPDGFHGANIQKNPAGTDIPGQVWVNTEAEKYWDNGLLLIGGGQFHNYSANSFFANVKSGIQLVDLGGEIGTVFALAYRDTDVNEALLALTGYDYGIHKADGQFNWFNLNFFSDPKNTPTKKDGTIKVRIVYNVYNPTADPANNVVNNIHFKTQDNGTRPEGVAFGPMTLADSFTYDEDMEEDNYDITKWCVYEFIGDCPDKGDGEVDYAPMRVCINLPDSPAKSTLFIREISLTHIQGGEETTSEATQSYITLKPGEPNSAAVKAVEIAEDAPVEYFNLQGIRVANPENGLYIRRQGTQATKVLVK